MLPDSKTTPIVNGSHNTFIVFIDRSKFLKGEWPPTVSDRDLCDGKNSTHM